GLRPCDAGRAVRGKAVLARGAYGNIGYGPGLALAVLGTKAAAPTALIFLLRQYFSLQHCAALHRTDGSRSSVRAARAYHGGTSDRAKSVDHVGGRGCSGGCFLRSNCRLRSTIRFWSCKTRRRQRPVRAWRDCRAAFVQAYALGRAPR